MPLSLSLFLLPFSFVNPPLLPVIIYPYVSQLFSLLLFPFHPIYFLLYLNFTRLCSSLFLLVIFLFLFLIISPSITLYAPHSLFSFLLCLRVVSPSFALLSISLLPPLSNITSLFYSLCQKNFWDSIFSFLKLSPFTHGTKAWGKKRA